MHKFFGVFLASSLSLVGLFGLSFSLGNPLGRVGAVRLEVVLHKYPGWSSGGLGFPLLLWLGGVFLVNLLAQMFWGVFGSWLACLGCGRLGVILVKSPCTNVCGFPLVFWGFAGGWGGSWLSWRTFVGLVPFLDRFVGGVSPLAFWFH